MASSTENNLYETPGDDVTVPSTPPGLHQHHQTPYRFTNEELRVLRQCNKESFYQRSLPLSTLLGLGTYFGVKAGYLRSNARFGPTPKVLVAVTVGYFVGKFSYQSKCAEKIMQLPNSPIAEMLRRRKRQGGGGFQDTLTMDSGFPSSTFSNLGSSDAYSDLPPQHDLDFDRPMHDGLDDLSRPIYSNPVLEEEDLPSTGAHTPPTTYEELRRKNREEYEQRKTKQYRGVTSQEDVPSVIRQRPTTENAPQPPSSWNREKNKYGDVWEE